MRQTRTSCRWRPTRYSSRPAAAAVDLHGAIGRVPGGVRGEELRLRHAIVGFRGQCLRRPGAASLASLAAAARSTSASLAARSISIMRDVFLHELVLADQLAVLHARPGVGQRLGQAILDHAQAAGGHAQRPETSVPIAIAKAVAFLAQQVFDRHRMIGHLEHAGVGGEHAQLGVQVFGLERGAGGVDDKRAHAAIFAGGVLGIGKQHHGVGDAAVGDQVLDAVEQELVARCGDRCVVISSGLEPASGSVRPKARIFSPRHEAGR